MNNPKIFILVEGGVIQNITTNIKIDVMVIDCDIEGSDKYQIYKDLDGNNFEGNGFFYQHDISKKIINHYFKQLKNQKGK